MNKYARHLAILSLCLAPLLWLWPCVFGGRTFVPYDVAQFPPISLTSTPAQLEVARDGANFDVTEVPPWFLPELILARDELREGRLPTWNPHARGGAPLHAHGLIGLCYPPNWVALFADDPSSRLVFIAWINLALGGLLAFGLLRALGLGVLAAWFGALVFELSGPMATNAFFWMRLASFLWLPGVLWAVHATVLAERLRARHLAGLGLAFACTWLAGFPPFAITTSFLGGVFALWLVVTTGRASGWLAARNAALRVGCGLALGGMLAAPQVLPSMLFFPQSTRASSPAFHEVGASAFEAYGVLGYLLPDALGHPSAQAEVPYAQQNVLGLLLNPRLDAAGKAALPNFNYTEYAVYVGTLALLLAFVGALLGRTRHRGFAITALLLCVGMALFVPVVNLLFHLPLIQNVAPMRWLAPATIFVAWLAAAGLQRLITSARRLPVALAAIAATLAITIGLVTPRPSAWHAEDRTWAVQRLASKYATDSQGVINHVQGVPPFPVDRFERAFERLGAEGTRAAWWLAASAALLILFALLRTPQPRSWLAITAGVTTALQLGWHGSTVTQGSHCAQSVDTAVHTFLRERAADSAARGGFMIARGSGSPELPAQLPPGQLMAHGVRDLNFYTHFDGRSAAPLKALLAPIGELLIGKGYLEKSLPDALPAPRPFLHPLLDLLGVRYVLATELLHTAGPRVDIPTGPPNFFVHERPHALPRALAVAAVQGHRNDTEVVTAMLSETFAPATIAHALQSDLPSPPPSAPANAPSRGVTFVTDHATHIDLAVEAGDRPWLLLTDTFLPGWSATIDNVPTDIVRANHAYRLLPLPPGACRVTFRYDAPGLTAGLGLATFATLAWLLFASTAVLRSRRHSNFA